MKTSLSLHGAVLTGGYSAPGPALIPPPKSTRHVSVWLGDLKSSLWLFDRYNPNETRKDARKDDESREP